MDDTEIKTLVARLSRPHPTGAVSIERAAILADGTDFPAVIDWILAHEGTPDTVTASTPRRGLHGARLNDSTNSASSPPQRFLLPGSALD